MKKYTLYIIIGLLALVTGCKDRRNLWVLADAYPQVELVTDWSEAADYPQGMTAWFIDNNGSGYTRNHKTAEVEHSWLNLPIGNYTGLVFDYSPEEYGRLEFVNMNDPELAEVLSRPAVNQPVSTDTELFGDKAVPDVMWNQIPHAQGGTVIDAASPVYQVSAEPESISLDVLSDVNITSGFDGDYIKWRDKEDYTTDVATHTLYAWPKPIVWKLHVLVHVKGIYYLHSVRASIVGLASGYMMAKRQHNDKPCILAIDEWNVNVTGDNTGNITSSINTFGLAEEATWSTEYGVQQAVTRDGVIDDDILSALRLNLEFLLRDEETVLNYHFDVGGHVSIYEDQLVIRVDIPIELAPDLPYVMAKGGTGFDATVTPWENGGSADVGM